MAVYDGYVNEQDQNGSLGQDIANEAADHIKNAYNNQLSSADAGGSSPYVHNPNADTSTSTNSPYVDNPNVNADMPANSPYVDKPEDFANKAQTAQRGAAESANHAKQGLDAAEAAGMNAAGGQTAQDVASDVASDVAKEAGEEAASEAGKEVAKEGVKEGAASVAEGASGPVGWGILAAKLAAKATVRQVKDLYNKGTVESDYHVNPLAVFIVLFCSLAMAGTFLCKEIPGSVKNNEGRSYDQRIEDSGIQGDIEEKFNEDSVHEYDNKRLFKDAMNDYVYGIDANTGLRNALDKAITEECYHLILYLGNKLSAVGFPEWASRIIHGYDAEMSLESFYENPWPYDLTLRDDGYPKIGNVMSSYSGYEAYSPQYNDVNFIEMLSVLCQNEEHNWENVEYSKFNEYITTKRAKNLYYELEIKYVLLYNYVEVPTVTDDETGATKEGAPEEKGKYPDDVEYDTYEEMKAAAAANKHKVINGQNCDLCGFFIRTKVKPFGLRELYMMAEVDPYDYNRDFYYHTNRELLDRSERLLHTYLREDQGLGGVFFKDERLENSTIYWDMMARQNEANGRSLWCYIDNPYNITEDMDFSVYRNDSGMIGDLSMDELLKWMEDAGLDAKILLEMPKYTQGDWNYILAYANPNNPNDKNSTIATSGCGFTSMAMIASYFTGSVISPNDIGSKFNSYYIKGAGMSHSLPEAVAASYGFKTVYNQASFNVENAIQELNAGHPVVVSFHEGKYTTCGHISVITGYTEDGKFIVNDPSGSNQKKYGNEYSFEDVANNSKTMWSFEQ